jgi:hypothetical protein
MVHKVHNVIAVQVLLYGSECWTSTEQVTEQKQQIYCAVREREQGTA